MQKPVTSCCLSLNTEIYPRDFCKAQIPGSWAWPVTGMVWSHQAQEHLSALSNTPLKLHGSWEAQKTSSLRRAPPFPARSCRYNRGTIRELSSAPQYQKHLLSPAESIVLLSKVNGTGGRMARPALRRLPPLSTQFLLLLQARQGIRGDLNNVLGVLLPFSGRKGTIHC